MTPKVTAGQPKLRFELARGTEKQISWLIETKQVTYEKADNGVSLVEGLAINRYAFGYHTEIALTGSQPLSLEHVLLKNFVRLVIVGIC